MPSGQVPTMAYPSNKKLKFKYGSNGWIFWSIWDPVIPEFLPEILNTGQILMSTEHFNDLFDAAIRKLAHSFWGIVENPIVVCVTQMQFPPLTNKIIIADPAFLYNRYSNRIEIKVQIIPFRISAKSSQVSPNEGIWEQELSSPLVATIVAWGSLAQLLTLKVKINDVFIISGGNVELTKDKGRIELRLNEWFDGTEENRDHLDLIHLRFEMDEGLGNIQMLEKIEPIANVKNMFEFTYSTSKNTIGKEPYNKEVVIYRPFRLCENEETEGPFPLKMKKHEPFRVPIGRESREVNRVHMAMTFRTLCLLNYENERIEKRLKKKLGSKRTMLSLMNAIIIAGIILIVYIFFYHEFRH